MKSDTFIFYFRRRVKAFWRFWSFSYAEIELSQAHWEDMFISFSVKKE
jgi:hypothetical protein